MTTKKTTRLPVVAVLGHVDHGKTTLLDVLRKTHVQQKEAGGITQSIGATVATSKKGDKITFIDTPGHEAFKNMRSQGVEAADLAVLVVSADAGVKPQTIESIELIKKAKVPYLVALTKTDLPSADVEMVKSGLAKAGVSLEGKGGNIPVVTLSAKKNEGLDELLDVISLLSEVSEIGSGGDKLSAVVIETNKSKAGLVVAFVVKSGRITVRDNIQADGIGAKVRQLLDFTRQSVSEIDAGYPGLVLGFSRFPAVGSLMTKSVEGILEIKEEKREVIRVGENLTKGKIPVIVKALSTNSLDTVVGAIPDKVVVVDESVGEVTGKDVLLAKSTGAIIFAFESKVPRNIEKLAKVEGVSVKSFDIIYHLFEALEDLVRGDQKATQGRAEVLKQFSVPEGKIAGCKVVVGEIKKGEELVLKRGGKLMGAATVASLKTKNQDILVAGKDEECGILLKPQLDFKVGDVLVSGPNDG